jgi:beta-mannosidase
VPKAGYHFLQRVYAPLLASFKAVENGVELWLTNDLASDLSDQLTVRLGTFDGGLAWQESREVSIGAGASQCVWLLETSAASPAHYLHVSSASNAFPPNRHFFADIKDLQRQPLAPHMQLHMRGPHTLEADLTAPTDAYVYFAHLVSRHPSTHFSDNYVDILPGESRTLQVSDEQHELNAEALRLGWA